MSLTPSFLKYPFLNGLLMVVIDGMVQGMRSFRCDGFVCLSVCKGNVKPDPWESGPWIFLPSEWFNYENTVFLLNIDGVLSLTSAVVRETHAKLREIDLFCICNNELIFKYTCSVGWTIYLVYKFLLKLDINLILT